MNIIQLFIVTTLAALVLAGCSEEMAGQAQKVAAQLTEEAAKIANQKIDETKKQAIEKIKQVVGEPVPPKEGERQDKAFATETDKSSS